MIFRCFFASVLLALLEISSARSFGRQFEVDGIMTALPEGHQPFSCSMRLYFQDDRWAVFQIWEDPTNRIVTEISDDGDYVYELNGAETNTGVFMPDDHSKTMSRWSGEIHPQHFPFEILNTEAITLFYAYASSRYLDEHTNQVINSIPFQPGDETRNHEGTYAFITRSSPPLRLPSKIIFRAEFQYTTNAIFNASEFTKVADMQVPMKVSLARFLPGTSEALITYEFRATRVSGQCPLKSFKPALPDGAYVTDFRVRHFLASDPGSFRATTNGWPAMRTD